MNTTSPFTDALHSVENTLNVLGSDKDRRIVVINWFSTLHRTLQQQFVKVIVLPVLQHLAEDHELGYTDRRNQAAAALAHKMLAATDDNDRYLPFI
jgi:hypothetical protein